MSDLSDFLEVALLTWANRGIRSQLLICPEQSERIAHSGSFNLSDLSKWANSQPSSVRLTSAPAGTQTWDRTIGPSRAIPSLLKGVVLSSRTYMRGAITNTSYSGMPTSLGIVRTLIHCLRRGSLADKPRTSWCPCVSVYSWHYRLCHQSRCYLVFWSHFGQPKKS